MFRSLSRLVVAVTFILALVLSTAPAQAQPRDFGFGFVTSDASWIEVALGWLEDLLGGGDSGSLQTLETGGRLGGGGGMGTMSGSCIDPYGNPCVDIP